MRWDEERFGREYDLDRFMIFCADDFNMGAMENKGLNIFNSRLVLADPATATDDDYQAIEGVIGHEYFHNWTGNRVTCRDWFQLSLKEGLTVFRDQEFSSDLDSRAVERIAAVEYLRREQFAEDAGPMAHTVRPDEYQEINNFYTATVYEKGAEVIRMQHTLLGPRALPPRHGSLLRAPRRPGRHLRRLRAGDAGRVGRRPHAVQALVLPGGHAGRAPCAARYDAAARRTRSSVAQARAPTPGQPDKLPFHIPLAIGLVGRDGARPAAARRRRSRDRRTTRVLELRAPRAVVPLRRTCRAAGAVAAARLLGAGAASTSPIPTRELAFLAAHDSDPVNRWDAAQRSFANAMLCARARAPRRQAAGAAAQRSSDVVAHAARRPRERSRADRARADAARSGLRRGDGARRSTPTASTAARAFLDARARARTLRDAFERSSSASPRARVYAPTHDADRRAQARATCACATSARSTMPPARALAVAHYDAADNMTDTFAALAAIKDSDAAERDDLFARFEARWRDEPLVLDKWFALEATSERDGHAARVQALLAHPRFNARNPNRVRSLVGAFALRNFARFNAADGGGYAFVADQVLALDADEPAARRDDRRRVQPVEALPEPRRGLHEGGAAAHRAAPGLSPDVTEIVTRTLVRVDGRAEPFAPFQGIRRVPRGPAAVRSTA